MLFISNIINLLVVLFFLLLLSMVIRRIEYFRLMSLIICVVDFMMWVCLFRWRCMFLIFWIGILVIWWLIFLFSWLWLRSVMVERLSIWWFIFVRLFCIIGILCWWSFWLWFGFFLCLFVLFLVSLRLMMESGIILRMWFYLFFCSIFINYLLFLFVSIWVFIILRFLVSL